MNSLGVQEERCSCPAFDSHCVMTSKVDRTELICTIIAVSQLYIGEGGVDQTIAWTEFSAFCIIRHARGKSIIVRSTVLNNHH